MYCHRNSNANLSTDWIPQNDVIVPIFDFFVWARVARWVDRISMTYWLINAQFMIYLSNRVLSSYRISHQMMCDCKYWVWCFFFYFKSIINDSTEVLLKHSSFNYHYTGYFSESSPQCVLHIYIFFVCTLWWNERILLILHVKKISSVYFRKNVLFYCTDRHISFANIILLNVYNYCFYCYFFAKQKHK